LHTRPLTLTLTHGRPSASSHETLKLSFDWRQRIARALVAHPLFAHSRGLTYFSSVQRMRLTAFARAGSMVEALRGAASASADPIAKTG
jgi:hypothetical protein